MIDDVKDVVPEDYWLKHLSTNMRKEQYHKILDGSAFSFHVLCKVDTCLTPRDLAKLKENLTSYSQEIAKDPRKFPSEIMEKLLAAIYEKQVDGMGKYNHFTSTYQFIEWLRIDNFFLFRRWPKGWQIRP